MSATGSLTEFLHSRWESLRSQLLGADPALARRIEEALLLDWRSTTARDRAAALAAVKLGLDLGTPAGWREARRLADVLLADPQREDAALAGMDAEGMAAIRRGVQWLASKQCTEQLAQAAGPAAAIKLVNRKAESGSRRVATMVLLAIGYPALRIDGPRRRWLARFGLLPDETASAANDAAALDVLLTLAWRVHADAREIDLLAEAMCGSEGPCGRKPRCGTCALAESCQHGEAIRRVGVVAEAPARGLSDVMLPEDRPREKLITRGPGVLGNAELLAILLRTGTQQENVLDLANRLLRVAGSLSALGRFTVEELAKISGVGPTKAATIKAALELAKRLLDESASHQRENLGNPRVIFARYRSLFLGLNKELFVAVHLNTKLHVIRHHVISEGTLNSSLVHPREAFVEALRDGAFAVVFIHNHPSGDPTPSLPDHRITKQLVDAGNILGVKVLDHVIFGREAYYSYADEGTLNTAS